MCARVHVSVREPPGRRALRVHRPQVRPGCEVPRWECAHLTGVLGPPPPTPWQRRPRATGQGLGTSDQATSVGLSHQVRPLRPRCCPSPVCYPPRPATRPGRGCLAPAPEAAPGTQGSPPGPSSCPPPAPPTTAAPGLVLGLVRCLPCRPVGKDPVPRGRCLCGILGPSGLRHKPGSEGAGQPGAYPKLLCCQHPGGICPITKALAVPSLQPSARCLPKASLGPPRADPFVHLGLCLGPTTVSHQPGRPLLCPTFYLPAAPVSGYWGGPGPGPSAEAPPKMLFRDWISPSGASSWGSGRLTAVGGAGPGEVPVRQKVPRGPGLRAAFLIFR